MKIISVILIASLFGCSNSIKSSPQIKIDTVLVDNKEIDFGSYELKGGRFIYEDPEFILNILYGGGRSGFDPFYFNVHLLNLTSNHLFFDWSRSAIIDVHGEPIWLNQEKSEIVSGIDFNGDFYADIEYYYDDSPEKLQSKHKDLFLLRRDGSSVHGLTGYHYYIKNMDGFEHVESYIGTKFSIYLTLKTDRDRTIEVVNRVKEITYSKKDSIYTKEDVVVELMEKGS